MMIPEKSEELSDKSDELSLLGPSDFSDACQICDVFCQILQNILAILLGEFTVSDSMISASFPYSFFRYSATFCVHNQKSFIFLL